MSDQPSHIVDRAETKAVRAAERSQQAQQAWLDHDEARARRTAELRAQRLARDAAMSKTKPASR